MAKLIPFFKSGNSYVFPFVTMATADSACITIHLETSQAVDVIIIAALFHFSLRHNIGLVCSVLAVFCSFGPIILIN